MSKARARGQSVSEIVDAAVALYRRDGLRYIGAAAIAYAPWLVVQIVFRGVSTTAPPGQVPSFRTIGVTLALTLGLGLLIVLMSAMVIKVGSEAYLGQEPDLAGAVRQVAPQVGTVLLACLMKYALLFIAMVGVGGVALVVSTNRIMGPGLRLAPIVLAIAGSFAGFCYVFARYFAVTPAIVLEGIGAWEALGRSTMLSRGRTWQVLRAMLLVGAIYILLSVGVHVLLRPTPLVIQLVVSMLFTVVAYPIIGLTQMLLYYDARIMSEASTSR